MTSIETMSGVNLRERETVAAPAAGSRAGLPPPIRIVVSNLVYDDADASADASAGGSAEDLGDASAGAIPMHPTLSDAACPAPASNTKPAIHTSLPSRAPSIEEQIDELISYEEPGCLCCKRFFCHDERNVSTDDLILEKDRLNLRQLLNHEAYKVGANFQEEDDAREAKRRNCRKVLTEAAISVNCLKLPFAQFNKLSARRKAGVIFVQSIWVCFLVLWFSVNKYERYNCHANPLMRPGQDYTYEKYHCLVESGYFQRRNSSQSEFEQLAADPASGWNTTTTETQADFESWKKRTKFNGPVEYMEIFTTLCDRAISVAAMYMFHVGTYTEALYPPMLDETFFSGAGTLSLAVRRPRKYIQQVRC